MEIDADSLYRRTFWQAAKRVWRHPGLIWLGIGAAFLGNGGDIEVALNKFFLLQNQGDWLSFFVQSSWLTWFGTIEWAALPIIVFGLVVGLALMLLGSLAQVAVIHSAHDAASGEVADVTVYLRRARGLFLKAFSFYALSKILIWAVFIILILPALINAFFQLNLEPNSSITIIGYLVLIPGSFYLSLLARLSIFSLVLSGSSWKGALRQARALWNKHWLALVEVSAVVFLANTIFALAVAAIFFLGLSPVNAILSSGPAAAWGRNIIMFIFLLVVILVGGLISLWQYQVWTQIYTELISDLSIRSKAARVYDTVITKLKNRFRKS